MRIPLIGAAGIIDRKLAARLAMDGALGGQRITARHLVDVIATSVPAGLPAHITAEAADLFTAWVTARLSKGDPNVIFHLTAVVSGEAEVDFDKIYAVDLDGTRALSNAVRAIGNCLRVAFTPSLALFGPPCPAHIPVAFAPQPATSYGTQKLIVEFLVNDLTRKSVLDGISLRLPAVCMRPGAPNRMASGFFSGSLSQPLEGCPADLPVQDYTRHDFASPRAAVGFFLHAGPVGHRGRPDRRTARNGGQMARPPDPPLLRAASGEDRRGLGRELRSRAGLPPVTRGQITVPEGPGLGLALFPDLDRGPPPYYPHRSLRGSHV